MPLYEYKCKSCDGSVVKLRPMNSRFDPVNCPQCGEECIKQIGRPNVHMDYSGLEHFSDPRFAEAQARKCGVPV